MSQEALRRRRSNLLSREALLPRSLFLKRVFDVVGATVGLVCLSPVILGVAVVIRWKMGEPILFKQARPGLGAKAFVILKFRTMSNASGPGADLTKDGERLTPLGRFLRSTSLDELPELWNVLRGDMSLVGPAPAADTVSWPLFRYPGPSP